MPYVPKRPSEPVPAAPSPSAASAPEGTARARELARRYLPNGVRLFAAVAFAEDSEASLWVKVQRARLLAEVAGAIPQAVPEAPRPHEGADDSSERD